MLTGQPIVTIGTGGPETCDHDQPALNTVAATAAHYLWFGPHGSQRGRYADAIVPIRAGGHDTPTRQELRDLGWSHYPRRADAPPLWKCSGSLNEIVNVCLLDVAPCAIARLRLERHPVRTLYSESVDPDGDGTP